MVNIEVKFDQRKKKPHMPLTKAEDTMFPEISKLIQSGEIKQKDIIHVTEGNITFSGLSEGMTSGRPSFLIYFMLTEQDGTKRPVLIESSMRSFKIASDLLLSRFESELV